MGMFGDALAHAENKRDNWGVPDYYKAKFKIDIGDLKDKQITIDKVCVVCRPALSKDGAFIKTKNGEQVYNSITYIAFGDDKYTVTKSALMASQIDEIEHVVYDEEKETFVPQLDGAEVIIKFKSVKYADKKMYDQPYLDDAN